MRILLIVLIAISSLCAKETLLTRPVIIGASVGDGFELDEFYTWGPRPQSDALALDKALSRELSASHGPILNLADRFFFFLTEDKAINQVDDALAHQPTVIIALDYLFWQIYGHRPKQTTAERLARLEQGLIQLARFDCPVLVGDLPDARASVGRILVASQVPAVATLEEANARLRTWATNRPNVHLISLYTFLQATTQNEAVQIHGLTIPAGQSRRLLQRDLLHPNQAGTRLLARSIRHQLLAINRRVDE